NENGCMLPPQPWNRTDFRGKSFFVCAGCPCHPQIWIMATEPERTYPSELPVLALRQTVVFPLTLQPLAINRPMSIETVNHALAGDRLLFLSLQNNDKDDPEPGDLRPVGTIAAIRQMAKVPNGGVHVIIEGLTRAKSDV